MDIRMITKENKEDILLPNQAFPIRGKLLVNYRNHTWSHSVQLAETIEWQTFPDEPYNFEEMEKDFHFIGAYDGDTCVGLAILQEDMFNYIYLYDLKINQDYRKQGIASQLIDKSKALALAKGYRGVRTIAQDNNLNACLFYLSQGFEIGGFNTHDYKGTQQEGKADIYFYLDCEGK
ncbi:TPA: GNAT family N-acetyltransferase [Streptococcus suis]